MLYLSKDSEEQCSEAGERKEKRCTRCTKSVAEIAGPHQPISWAALPACLHSGWIAEGEPAMITERESLKFREPGKKDFFPP